MLEFNRANARGQSVLGDSVPADENTTRGLHITHFGGL